MPDATTNADMLKSEIVSRVGTPAVVVDLDIVDRNIARTQALCDAAGIRNRPHMKTHKNGMLARKQVKAGAIGVACQKLGEAEVMADAGLKDIFISYNIIGRAKLERLRNLQRRVTLSVAADSNEVIEGYAEAFADSTSPLTVIVECDTGADRCGAQSPGQVVDFARRIGAADGLAFVAGSAYGGDRSGRTRALPPHIDACDITADTTGPVLAILGIGYARARIAPLSAMNMSHCVSQGSPWVPRNASAPWSRATAAHHSIIS